MADNPEIRRARELLASVDKTLERCRNRPQVSSSWLDILNDPNCERVAAAPVVRKVRRDARVTRTMDPETQARWTKWAEGVARRVFYERTGQWLSPIVKEALDDRDSRIAALEQRIAELEHRLNGKVAPIRSAA